MYAPGVSIRLAERFGVARDYVDTARRFASHYSSAGLKELCRKLTPRGLPLTRNHVVQLTLVSDRQTRKELQAQATREGWSVRKLAATVLEERLKAGKQKGKAGRTPTIPKSSPEIARQVQRYCEQWQRWSRTLGERIDTDKEVNRTLQGVRQRVARLDEAIQKLHEVAGTLLAVPAAKQSGEAKRNHRAKNSIVVDGKPRLPRQTWRR